MKVPFFNYSHLYSYQKERLDKIVHDVMERGAYILQKDLEEFENALEKYCNVKHAIGVANGTDAIWLSLMASGVGKNDQVIIPSHTYVATPAAIKFVQAEPILVECSYDNLIDAKSIENSITDKTKAIMPVQLNGRTADMDKIKEIAEKNDLIIIEDAAQGLGSLYKNQMAGTFGIAGTYSFYPAKVLGFFGDGGAVVTNNDKLAKKIRLLRDHGRNEEGKFEIWGFNSRLDNLQAAILREKLKTFDTDIKKRRKLAGIYHERIEVENRIVLPPSPKSNSINFDTFQNFELRAKQRDQLKEFLAKKGIGTLIQWGGKAIHQEENLGLDNFNLPITDDFFKECLMLPMNTSLTEEQVIYVSDKINEFYNG